MVYSDNFLGAADALSALDIEKLRSRLPLCGMGNTIVYEPAIASTNSLCIELSRNYFADGLLVLTDAQPEGRGRQGKSWITMPRAQILMSLACRFSANPAALVMICASAVCSALMNAGVPAEDIAIKWPNDILVQHKKVAGILIESSWAQNTAEMQAIIGIGVNIFGTFAQWPEIAEKAATLQEMYQFSFSREDIICAVAAYIGDYRDRIEAAASVYDTVLQNWKARLHTLGKRVSVQTGRAVIAGVAEDTAEDGSLLVRTDNNELVSITWGDVQML